MSAFIDKIIATTSLHKEHQGELGDFYLLLKQISAQSTSDTATDPATELFGVRLAGYEAQDTVRRLREFLSQRCFTRVLGVPPAYKA